MAGYMLIERKMLQPHRTDGVPPNPTELSIFDYLRELRQEVFPFADGTRLLVSGIEDALLAAGSNRPQVMDEMHRYMAGRANELWQKRCTVQIVFDWPLSFGQELWFTRGASERVSLRPLFGNASQQHEGGNVYYLAGFNLT